MDVFKTLIHSQPGAVGSTVAITGGSINGTNIGATTPGSGAFTSLISPTLTSTAATNLTLSGGSSGASLVLGQGTSGVTSVAARNFDGDNTFTITQSNASASASATFRAINDSGIIGNVGVFSSGFTASNLRNYGGAYSTGKMLIGADFGLASGGSNPIDFFVGGYTTNAVARITSAGNLLIGGTTDISGSGGLKVFGTTASTSTTTGALVVSGGVGVAGAGYFGDFISAGSTSNTVSVFAGANSATASAVELSRFTAANLTTGAAFSTGAFSVFGVAASTNNSGVLAFSNVGGAGSATNVFTMGVYGASAGLTVNGNGQINATATTVSTSTTTGALVVSGGAGVAGNVVSGGVVRTGSFTVATLPSAATYPGGMAYVTDANATTRLSTVAGGGANKVMVYSDGTNWLIL